MKVPESVRSKKGRFYVVVAGWEKPSGKALSSWPNAAKAMADAQRLLSSGEAVVGVVHVSSESRRMIWWA